MTRTVFTNANLVDGLHPAKPDVSVVVAGDRIVAVEVGPIDLQPDDEVIDCAGRTLMPGMVSGHYHSTFRDVNVPIMPPLGLEYAPAFAAYVAADNARLTLESGFTSVVGAGCSWAIDPSLRDAIRAGLVRGPRMIPGSRDLITTADSNDTSPWWWDARASYDKAALRIADGPEEFRKAVREEIKHGAEIVKLYATGGHGVRLGSRVISSTQAELDAAVEAAHNLGARARAHVASKPAIMSCLQAGVDVLDHGDGLDEECIEVMAQQGTILVPSLCSGARVHEMFSDKVDEPTELGSRLRDFAAMCEILPAVVDAGITVCLGEDYGTEMFPHGTHGRELDVCVRHANISPLEAIRWATVNGAKLVGLDDLGRIETGFLADLIVVDGDPSVDPTVVADLANVHIVMRDGHLLVDRSPA